MNAFILHDIHDFRLETISKPVPKDNEVLVAVKAAGICGSDIPRIYQTGTYSYPLIPGHEFSGIVAELGANVDKCWLNQRVGIFPLIPCRSCIPCQREQYEMCKHYSYLGSRRDGGFAEYVAVPSDNLLKLPEQVSFEEAAMMEPMAVAVHAMRRSQVKPKDTVVICGLGTIGILLLMFLMEAGITNIFAVGNKTVQEQTVLSMGLKKEQYCDSKKEDIAEWIMEHTNHYGADVFFECVGKNETVAQAVNLTAPMGRICLVGNPGSEMRLEKAVYWKILRNQLTMVGTWNSSFTGKLEDDWHYGLRRLEEKRVMPVNLISHRFPLENALQGFHIMRDKTEEYIKIMLNIG